MTASSLVHAVPKVTGAALVLLLGKGKRGPDAGDPARVVPSLWSWRLAAVATLYVVVYFAFGYFIVWRSPAVRSYYGGTDAGGFFTQVLGVFRETPWLPVLQLLRGAVWTAVARLIVTTLRRSPAEDALCVGAIFRMAHLAETASPDFLLGIVARWLVRLRRHPVAS